MYRPIYKKILQNVHQTAHLGFECDKINKNLGDVFGVMRCAV